jgi:hypothetical protein
MVAAGWFTYSSAASRFGIFSGARRGRGSNSPPQFGHLPFSQLQAQDAQKVHSKEQMRASVDSGGSAHWQVSQFERISSMAKPSECSRQVTVSQMVCVLDRAGMARR